MHAFELGTVHCLPPRPVAAKPPVCISRRSHSRAQCRPERAGDARHTSTEVVYKDSWTDLAFIALCRRAYGDLAGWQSSRSWRDGTETFAGMVEVSRALMKGKSAAEQRDAVVAGFPRIPSWYILFKSCMCMCLCLLRASACRPDKCDTYSMTAGSGSCFHTASGALSSMLESPLPSSHGWWAQCRRRMWR